MAYEKDPFVEFYKKTSGHGTAPTGSGELTAVWPKEYPNAETVDLDGTAPSNVSLWDTLKGRRSRRLWDGEITSEEVGILLHRAAGVTGRMRAYGYTEYPMRAFPSPGGLQSTELYLVCGEETRLDWEPGVYHYRAVGNRLERIGGYQRAAGAILSLRRRQPWFSSGVPVLLVLTVMYGRLRKKYGVGAGRLAAMEVGWVGQNLYLVAEALGLSVCAINGVDDDALAHMLGVTVEDDAEFPMLVLGIGRASGAGNGECR